MIGIFDSGVGGLSVLRELKKISPQIDVIYFGDIQNVPYGIKSQEELKNLTLLGVKKLLENGATNIISACNSVSTFMLLKEIKFLSETPFEIIEMISPTVDEFSCYKNIAIFATPATIESQTYQNNFKQKEIEIKTFSIPELAGAIEFDLAKNKIEKIINRAVSKSSTEHFDVAILCCTRYSFVKKNFEKAFKKMGKKVKIFDPAETVAKKSISKFNNINGSGKLKFLISKDSPNFKKMVIEHFNNQKYIIEVIK